MATALCPPAVLILKNRRVEAPPAQGAASAPNVSSKPADNPTAIEAGADLGVLRHGTHARIDVENPY